MGEIFLFIGVWLMVSGATDIFAARKIRDTYNADDKAYVESTTDAKTTIEGSAVA